MTVTSLYILNDGKRWNVGECSRIAKKTVVNRVKTRIVAFDGNLLHNVHASHMVHATSLDYSNTATANDMRHPDERR